MSTPFRKRGFFYLNWEAGGPDWHRMRVPATECSRIPREFLEEERRHQKGDFAMEYMCEFVEDGHSVFNRDLVMKALDMKILPLEFPPMSTFK